MSHHDVIVAGIGGMGSAACHHLAKRGLRVLGLERHGLGHERGSSHGLTRIIRLAYQEGEHYVPLLRRAHALWRETGEAAGVRLLHVTGSLDIAPESDGSVQRSIASCVGHGLAHEVLDHAGLARRAPAFRLPAGHIANFQPDGGFVASERAIVAHAGLAQRDGAELRFDEPILSWRTTAAGGVEVRTGRTTYTAGHLVLAAGAWMPGLVPALGRVGTTVKQAIGWFATRRPELFEPPLV